MRNIFILMLLLPIMGSAQTSILEMMSNFGSGKKGDFLKENHIVLTFSKLYDEEEKPDTTIMINDEEAKFQLSDTEITTWKDNVLTKVSSSKLSNSKTTTKYTFSPDGNILSNEIIVDGSEEIADFMNEQKYYTYDALNRITNVRLVKQKGKTDYSAFSAVFEGDSKLPSSAKMSAIWDMSITKEVITNGFRYNFNTSVPKSLMDMARKEMGGNPTDAEIMKELGPMGKQEKAYSDITFIDDGKMKEELYKEDKAKKGKMILTARIIFDKNFNVLSKTSYENNEITEALSYEYNGQGKVTSIQNGQDEKKINEFDAQGNLIKEHTGFSTWERTYNNGKLVKEIETSDYGGISTYKIYRY